MNLISSETKGQDTEIRRNSPGRALGERSLLSWRSALGLQLALLIAILCLWQFLPQVGWLSSRFKFLDPFFVSSPTKVVQEIWNLLLGTNGVSIWPYLGITVEASVLGTAIGLVLGAGVGLLFSALTRTNQVIGPFVVAFNAMPRIALVPVIVIIFGATLTSSMVVAILVVFFLGFYNALAGGRSVPKELIANAHLLGASKSELLFKVRAPFVFSWTFAMLPNAVAFGLLSVVTIELVSGIEGVGSLILTATVNVDSTLSFALLIILSAVGLILNGITELARKRVLRWLP
jgi:NitT/TauT family transport system permease protein